MASSADVSSGDLATAVQYNNLRADVLNTSSGHTHTGTDSSDLGTLTADLTISQSGASQIEVISTANDAYIIINSDTDEGQDSEIIFESGGTARGRIEYNHHATANTQLMSFFTADNAVETLKLAGNLATFATAVGLGSNTLTTTGLVTGGGFTSTGDFTTTAQATDWDLIDNTASALSFDASGKTGILDIVTTNSSEGVTMSGTLGVTGTATLATVDIGAGAIDGTAIGASSASTGAFTTIDATGDIALTTTSKLYFGEASTDPRIWADADDSLQLHANSSGTGTIDFGSANLLKGMATVEGHQTLVMRGALSAGSARVVGIDTNIDGSSYGRRMTFNGLAAVGSSSIDMFEDLDMNSQTITSVASIDITDGGFIRFGGGYPIIDDNGYLQISNTKDADFWWTHVGDFGSGVEARNVMQLDTSAYQLSIGKGQVADAAFILDGNAVNYHIGLDDSADVLSMGKGLTLGTTTAFTIGSTPSVGFFRDAGANNLISIRPGATLTAANAEASMIYSEQGTVNWDNASGGDVTVAIQSAMALRTQAWAGASNTLTFSEAATLWIEGAPTDSDANVTITNKFALWVDSGDSRFDGQVYIQPANGTTDYSSIEIGKGRTGGTGGDSYVDLVSDATYTDYAARFISHAGVNGNCGLYWRGTGAFYINGNENAPFIINTQATERFRIDGAGNFTFSNVGAMYINSGNASNPIIQIKNSNADGSSSYFDFIKDSANPHVDDYLGIVRFIGDNVAAQSTVATSIFCNMDDLTDGQEDGSWTFQAMVYGTVRTWLHTTNTGTSNAASNIDCSMSGDLSVVALTETSDATLKENIQEIDTAIDTVKQLRPVTFDWKETKNSSIGFVAQDVEGLIPNVVKSYADGNSDKKYKSIKSSGILAHVTKALQESIEKIETLEAQVKELQEA